MSNLTQHKLFIGDDKKNTLFGVTFSFNHLFKNQTLAHAQKRDCVPLRLNILTYNALYVNCMHIT